MSEVETTKTAAPAPKLSKGSMPMPLVWYIKFHEAQDNKSAVAAKYFTTPGKIADIQGNSNQRYIVENMKWSEVELQAAAQKVKDNFTRGQDEDGNPLDPDNKRGTATTTAEDAEYSLDVIEKIASMEFADDAITLEEARAAYNEENPRKKRETKAETEETAKAEVEELAEEDLLD